MNTGPELQFDQGDTAPVCADVRAREADDVGPLELESLPEPSPEIADALGHDADKLRVWAHWAAGLEATGKAPEKAARMALKSTLRWFSAPAWKPGELI